MNFKERKKRRDLILIVFGVIFLIFVLKTQLNLLRTGVNKLFLPIKVFIYKTTESAKHTVKNLEDLNRILNENEELKKSNFRLKIDHRYIEELQSENKRLKDILDIKNTGNKDFLVANISFKDPMSVYDEFIIDKGSDHGIKEGMPVVTRDVLLGRVIKVYKDKALVELISKAEKYTSVVVGPKKHLAILKGGNSNKLSIENIETDATINVGDRIYTSGITQMYPKDYYIGVVSKVETKKENLFKKIELVLPFNVFELNEVIIIK